MINDGRFSFSEKNKCPKCGESAVPLRHKWIKEIEKETPSADSVECPECKSRFLTKEEGEIEKKPTDDEDYVLPRTTNQRIFDSIDWDQKEKERAESILEDQQCYKCGSLDESCECENEPEEDLYDPRMAEKEEEEKQVCSECENVVENVNDKGLCDRCEDNALNNPEDNQDMDDDDSVCHNCGLASCECDNEGKSIE